MKKLYEKYIKIPKDEIISESVFKSRILLSVIAILSCLTIMISTAFAFFNVSLTRNFEMYAAVWDVSVKEETKESDNLRKFILSSCGTATEGYCKIQITNPDNVTEEYYTTSFEGDIVVNIQSANGCKIEFFPMWGKPANYGVTETYDDGGTIIFNHSNTQQTKDVEKNIFTTTTETEEIELESQLDVLSELITSNNNEELSDLGESTTENTEDSLTETSESSDESLSSVDSSIDGESGSASEVPDVSLDLEEDSTSTSNNSSVLDNSSSVNNSSVSDDEKSGSEQSDTVSSIDDGSV